MGKKHTNWKERAESRSKSLRNAHEGEGELALAAAVGPTAIALAAPSLAGVMPGPSAAQLAAMAAKPGVGQALKSARVYGPLLLAGALAYYGGRGRLARIGCVALGAAAGTFTAHTTRALDDIRAGTALSKGLSTLVVKE